MKIIRILGRIAAGIFFGFFGLYFLALVGLEIFLNQQPAGKVSEFAADVYQPVPTPGSDDLQLIEGNAEIKIPFSAREIYARTDGFQDIDTWVRFDLPPEDLVLFLRNARCTTPLEPTKPRKVDPYGLAQDWWQPHLASTLKECSGLHDYLSQHILVDTTRPDMLRIYVFSITANFTAYTTLTPKPE